METQFKMDTKRITIIGFGFFVILMTWQVYNTYCPLFLNELLQNRYGGEEEDYLYVIGIIMAADNVLALFMLPLFGKLSDKTNTKMGKRMPYIAVGLVLTALVFPFMAVAFINNSLVGLIIVMLLFLIIMNIYRSPVVSLMPDITPKPVRSKANGLINLIGYVGAIFAGGLAMVFAFDADNPNPMLVLFIFTSVLIFAIFVVLIKTINENAIIEEHKEELELGEKSSETESSVEETLSTGDKKNFWILIFAALFWYMGFNALETYLSLFAEKFIEGGVSTSGLMVIVMTFSSLITFMPAGNLSLKVGRKLIVLIGLVLLVVSFALFGMFASSAPISLLMFLIFFVGVGWAMINVNAYPMIVEMANKENVGTYTGYYYTSTMAAQSITPVLIGLIMTKYTKGLELLFPYASLMMAVALVIFIFFKSYKSNDSEAKKGLSAFDIED